MPERTTALASRSFLDEASSLTLRRRVAFTAAIYLALVLLLALFARVQLPQAPQATTIFATGVLVTDTSTFYLLLGLARQSRAWSSLLLACAYLFGATMALLHLLTFPGAVVPGVSVLGGPQAVGLLYSAWRVGFPMFVIAAVFAEAAARTFPRGITLTFPLASVATLTALLGVAATAEGYQLPQLIAAQNRFTTLNLTASWAGVAACACGIVLALVVTRGRKTLYLWICLGLLGFGGDILLGAVGGSRYTVGWYGARASGLLSASALLLFFLARFGRQSRLLSSALGLMQERTRALEAEVVRRKEVEHRLLQAQKMEALGQLTGGIAHDFNNLMMVIGARLRMLAAGLPDAGSNRHLPAIEQAIARCEGLTRQLLSFSRRRPVQPRAIHLAEEMPRLAELLQPSLRGDIRLEYEVAPDTWSIEADVGELELALLNAAMNARDAMPNGGTFRIAVCNETLAPDQVAGTPGGLFVRIAISDDGNGIPPDLLPRVFEPFFTTKESGRGTGLGLSQVYGFARQCGGFATIDSQLNWGTTLTLHLPRSAKRVLLPTELETAVQVALPEGVPVLVVEDNDAVADVLVEMLQEIGCDVRRAATAGEALALLKDVSHRPALVLTDILMPGGMNGLDLARTLRTRYPDLPVLLTTGYSSAAQDALAEGFAVLAKPYQRMTLEQAIADALPLGNSMRV